MGKNQFKLKNIWSIVIHDFSTCPKIYYNKLYEAQDWYKEYVDHYKKTNQNLMLKTTCGFSMEYLNKNTTRD